MPVIYAMISTLLIQLAVCIFCFVKKTSLMKFV